MRFRASPQILLNSSFRDFLSLTGLLCYSCNDNSGGGNYNGPRSQSYGEYELYKLRLEVPLSRPGECKMFKGPTTNCFEGKLFMCFMAEFM